MLIDDQKALEQGISKKDVVEAHRRADAFKPKPEPQHD